MTSAASAIGRGTAIANAKFDFFLEFCVDVSLLSDSSVETLLHQKDAITQTVGTSCVDQQACAAQLEHRLCSSG
jgi:hypothetical protein